MARGFSLKKTNFKISDEVKQGISDFENKITEERRNEIQQLSLSRIVPNPKNNYSISEIETLADLIRDHGQLQPALVAPQGDSFRLIAGERRFRALQRLGRDTIDAIVLEDLSAVDEEILLISANSYRTKTDVEKAWELARLSELYKSKEKEMPGFLQGRSVAQAVARQAGTSVITVNRAQRLDRLIPQLKELVDAGALGSSSAILFADLHPENQMEIVEVIRSKAANNETFSREEAKLVQLQYKEYKKQAEAEKKRAGQKIRELQKQLRDMDAALKEQPSEAERLREEKEQLERELASRKQQKASLTDGPSAGGVDEQRVKLRYSLSAVEDALDTLEKHLAQIAELRELVAADEGAGEDFRQAAERLRRLEELLGAYV